MFGEIWFGSRFEIWNLRWEKSDEILGQDFSTCRESTKNFAANLGADFGANFGENLGNFVSNSRFFFGNFVQQKGGANKMAELLWGWGRSNIGVWGKSAARKHGNSGKILGACAMTTEFLENKFPLSNCYCRGVSHENKCFWTIVPLCPQAPLPPKANILFLLSSRRLWESGNRLHRILVLAGISALKKNIQHPPPIPPNSLQTPSRPSRPPPTPSWDFQ